MLFQQKYSTYSFQTTVHLTILLTIHHVKNILQPFSFTNLVPEEGKQGTPEVEGIYTPVHQ